MGQRYSKSDYLNGKFYQLSKELFKGKYKKLSNNERVLYSILKDRFELSIKNEWVDSDNNIYFIFEQVQLSEECCMSLKTVQRAMQNLVESKLIDSVRQGQNLPNKLYLLKPDQEDEVINSYNKSEKNKKINENIYTEESEKKENEILNLGTSQNDLSGQVKKSLPDKSKSPTIYTNIIYTDNIYTSSSKEEDPNIDYPVSIKTKIDIAEILREQSNESRELINKVYNIIDKFCLSSKDGIMKINDEMINTNLVKNMILQKLDKESFTCIVDAIGSTTSAIKQMRPYVISCFYNYAIGNMTIGSICKKKKSSFNNFQQNNYDFEELEKEILQN